MSQPGSVLSELLRAMEPTLHHGIFVFVSVPYNLETSGLEPIATFRETEGLTLILPEEQAQRAGFQVLFRAAWITLTVHSDLQAVGLTAAVSSALAQANISCNVVAAAFHDHIFVPVESAHQALATLQRLQALAVQGSVPVAR